MTDLPAAAVRTTFATAARLRHARVFHPNGLQLSGRLHAESEFEPLFGTGERAVIARLSKGIGTPDGLPDVLGFAFRVLDRDNKPWDFALATTGRGPLTRFLITPALGWVRARYGSLMPYRIGKSVPTWIFAEPDAGQPNSPSLEDLRDHLREHPITFTLTSSGVRVPTQRLAEITLHLSESGDQRTDYFDPMLNHPPEVRMVPEVIGKVREFAYAGSRSGRGEVANG